MSYLTPPPAELEQVEYVRLYFHMEFNEKFDLPELGLLRLRRELLKALQVITDWGGEPDYLLLKELLQPRLSPDPAVRRLAQKPAPAFVLTPDVRLAGTFRAGQRLVLPALFIGQGVQAAPAFVRLVAQLGQLGLSHGSGRCHLEGLEAEDGSGVRSMLWTAGQQMAAINTPINHLRWWLEQQQPCGEQLQLEFISPLRLLKDRKPLFKASFSEFFPYLLRRVSAMLSCHAGVEVIMDPQRLTRMAESLHQVTNQLRWYDYRSLTGQGKVQNLGGLQGSIILSGPELGELLWLIQLGSLLNVGKEATYGAGQFCLRTLC